VTATDVRGEGGGNVDAHHEWDLARGSVGEGGHPGEGRDEGVREDVGLSRHWLRARILVGVALVGVAALLIAFFAYIFVFSSLTAARNQQILTASLLGHPLTVSSLVDGHPPSDGRAIAVLDIRSLGLHEVVVQGTSAADLMKGPGLLPGSVLPGTPGNAVIAGRRVTFGAPFGKVGTLQRGRTIKVIDGAGTFTYVVTHVGTVLSGRRDVIGPTAANQLTLITADSGLLTSGRLVVVAQLKGSPAKVDVVRGRIPTNADRALNGDSAAGWLTILWTLITVGVIVAAAAAAMRWGQLWLVYLFALPIVLMCGLFACEALSRALPATF
jgi:sortase A